MGLTDQMCLRASSLLTAKGAFGCLWKCLFSRKDVTYEGKRKVYEKAQGKLHVAQKELGCGQERLCEQFFKQKKMPLDKKAWLFWICDVLL
jgi:hypothetical protein